MKFYLINPKLPLSFTSNEYAAQVVLKKYSVPPLGLLTAAGMIPSGHDVVLCDENVQSINWDHEADVVGITGMHLQGAGMRKIAKHFRARGAKVIIGGPSTMALPDRYRDVADVLMLGEAEQIWPECIADLEKGTVKAAYTPADTVNLHTSPIPRYDLISRRDYMQISLQTTRGCPFQCEFCDIITLYGRKVRTKAIEQVIAEVDRVLALGWDRLFFVDDNFIGDPRYAMELAAALAARRRTMKKPFVFSTQLTINLAHNAKLLQALFDAGCRAVFVGIETPRVSSLQETLKFQNVRKDLLGDVARIQSQGIAVYSGLMVGFDHDDTAIFDEQLEFIQEAKIPLPMPSMVGALPGTPLYNRLSLEGRLIPETEAQGNTYHTNIIPKLMTMDELELGYRRMVKGLYDPVNYVDRVLGEIELLNRAHSNASNYKWPIILAGYLWVLLWYLADPNRANLLRAYARLVPRIFTRFPKAADAGLQRLVTYRHACRFASMVEQQYTGRPAAGTPEAPELSVSVPA